VKIDALGFDPSFSNWGIAFVQVDIVTGDYTVSDLRLIKTEGESKKGVIKASDDLRRARDLRREIVDCTQGYKIAFTEVPLGNAAMYNNAILSAGVVTGVLAGLPQQIIQVFPQEVKQLATGSRHAAKEEMIEWATQRFPDAPWLTRKLKGKTLFTKDNEHLADAVAAVHAGVRSQQFQQLMALYASKHTTS
jgi:Holliday junction resolvasome RuvABC endonuclease subunit